MKNYNILFFLMLSLLVWSCNDDDFLNRKPVNVLNEDQVWNNASVALNVLVDLYDRESELMRTDKWYEFTNYDDAFPSASGDYWRARLGDYDYVWWEDWDYGYIRDINLFIEKCSNATNMDDQTERVRMVAEARFLRALNYFEKVKRMGGVPLILKSLKYDYSGDPTYLQYPRAKEAEVYDFVIAELDTVKSLLPNSSAEKSRATKGAALAVQSRAALYAASIAKYGASTPEVSLPGGEVSIPASRADAYYKKALAAAKEIVKDGKYSLYNKKPDLEDNFASIFYDEDNNNEAILVRDYKLKSGKIVGFTLVNQPWSGAEDLEGGRLNPSLNLVQSFEKLDNTSAPLSIKSGNDYVYYNSPADVFAGRDARLGGTVILPGTKFKGKPVDIWAGYIIADGRKISSNTYAGVDSIPGRNGKTQVVGYDGPINSLEFTAQTGFYIRKYMDPNPGSGMRGPQSGLWWIQYRYGEVLLNAAEAAFELNKADSAAFFINQVRERAGFKTPLTPAEITFDRIVHERKVELAFEGHYLWDMKRWRLAHKVWNGENVNLTTNPMKADEPSTRPFGLWPYKYYNPASPNHGKYVFEVVLPREVTGARRFRMGNYYSRIGDDNIANNPLLVRNPNQN
ncbi:MAG TPA: RagB/SusD family nutrient uptake outer membrane protein [Bacteroidales bacterium]|nr:RagB/SusD family nutrient uptake outer membrane protein [Bacteroidales bacterium]